MKVSLDRAMNLGRHRTRHMEFSEREEASLHTEVCKLSLALTGFDLSAATSLVWLRLLGEKPEQEEDG